MAQVLPAGDKIKDYDSRVDPDAPPEQAKAQAEHRQAKHGIFGSFSLVQLHVITLVLVLTSSGLVPLDDIAFAIFTSVYMFVMNRLVFKPVTKGSPPNVMAGNSIAQKYAILTAGIGLVLPAGYILGAFVHGDQKALRAASPHLFLLSCQILSENIAFSHDGISLPIRALVPLFYNTRRLFTLMQWVKVDMNKGLESVGMHGAGVPMTAAQWIMFGRYLAMVNMGVWTFNLFFFLIPVFLPRTFKKHYEMESMKSENRAKDAHDVSS
jgi:hypothetical protein